MKKLLKRAAITVVSGMAIIGWGPMPAWMCGAPNPNKQPVEWQERAVRGSGGDIRWHNTYPYAYWSAWVLAVKTQWNIDNCVDDILRFRNQEGNYNQVRAIVPYCSAGATPGVGLPMAAR